MTFTAGRALAAAVVLFAAWSAAAVADGTFRCGARLVERGMPQSEVLGLCGEPTSKVVEIQDVRNGTQVVGTTTVSRWTFESYSATRVLVFDGDKLVSIQ